jgi:tetratricopeptide (TPR) repeat protein
LRLEHVDAASSAVFWYYLAANISPRRLGLRSIWDSEFDFRRAWLHVVLGDLDEAKRLLRAAAEHDGMRESYAEGIFMIHLSTGRGREAFAFAEHVLLDHREMHGMLDHFVQLSDQLGMTPQAVALCEARLERFPEDVPTIRWLALMKLDKGEMAEGIELLERAVELAPDNATLAATLSMALTSAGRPDDARQALADAIQRMPHRSNSTLIHFLPFAGIRE